MSGLHIIPLFDRIDRDQIYMPVQRFYQLCQFLRITSGIIDASHKAVFKSYPSSGLLIIVPARIQNFGQRIFIRHGHQ